MTTDELFEQSINLEIGFYYVKIMRHSVYSPQWEILHYKGMRQVLNGPDWSKFNKAHSDYDARPYAADEIVEIGPKIPDIEDLKRFHNNRILFDALVD